MPFNSFAEYAREPNPETKKEDVVWFAVNDGRPLPHEVLTAVIGASGSLRPESTKRRMLVNGQGSFRSSPAVNTVSPSSAALKNASTVLR